jgi:hypothetical protein
MNYKKQSIKQGKAIVALSIALISSAAIASPVFAEITVFSGNTCRPANSTEDAKLTSGHDYIYNFSSTYAYVTCPINQRFPSDSSGTSTSSSIRVLKYNTQELSCTLKSTSLFSSTLGTGSAKTTYGNGFTYMETSSVPKGHTYGLLCHLPPSSGIYSYEIRYR